MHTAYSATPRCVTLVLASMLSQLPNATAQNMASNTTVAEGRPIYIGDTAQLSVGITNNARMHFELNGVLHESDRHTWLGEGWMSNGAGGVKLSHHKFNGQDSVHKLFVALDQNSSHDRKISLGYGRETAIWFGQINLSQRITGKRLVGQEEADSQTQLSGQFENRLFLDTITQSTYSRIFEKAFDHGVGLRLGRYFDSHNLRLSAGLDHERGQGQARLDTASLMVEKMFPGTPHSIALQLSRSQKAGSLESTRSDSRGLLMYRYSLGRVNSQPERLYQVKRSAEAIHTQASSAPITSPAPPQVRIDKQWIKTKVTINTNTFFEFNSAKLTPAAQIELDRIAQILQTQGREGPMLITGHTCDIGSNKVNDRLSLARGQSVKNYFIKLGVLAAEDSIVQGLGKRAPKYPATDATREKNRRVELEFFSFVDKENLVAVTIPQTTPETQTVSSPAIVTYDREPVSQPPSWIQRALRNPGQHNRIVSVYRYKEETKQQSTQRQWVNQSPIAQNDTYNVAAGSTTVLDILANDRDPDPNDTIALASVSNPIHGQASLEGRYIVYRAPTSYVGTDTFSYTIKDKQGLTATAQVTLILEQANRPPQANDDRIGVSGYVPSQLNVTGNDADPDGDPLTITSITQPMANSGRLEITPNGILFTPKAPFMVDWFNYTIIDGKGGSSSATVQLIDP